MFHTDNSKDGCLHAITERELCDRDTEEAVDGQRNGCAVKTEDSDKVQKF